MKNIFVFAAISFLLTSAQAAYLEQVKTFNAESQIMESYTELSMTQQSTAHTLALVASSKTHWTTGSVLFDVVGVQIQFMDSHRAHMTVMDRDGNGMGLNRREYSLDCDTNPMGRVCSTVVNGDTSDVLYLQLDN